MGVLAYLQQAYMTEEDLAALPLTEQALYENIPTRVTAAFALAVVGGALACILLLMRKKLAATIFLISLIAVIIQMSYNLFMSKAVDAYGSGDMLMPIMVIIIAVSLLVYSKKQVAKGILS